MKIFECVEARGKIEEKISNGFRMIQRLADKVKQSCGIMDLE